MRPRSAAARPGSRREFARPGAARRAAPLAAVALLVAACGARDAREPFLESRTPPELAGRFYPPEGWAWGLVQAGDAPPQRYGVAATTRVPRAQVLIVPGYGESAEVWFETARDLIARGATVWILDRAGQGGSGRFAGPRDIVHAPSFAPDVAGLRAMRREVIRPEPERPFSILASADGAVPALLAVSQGLQADALILSAPELAAASPTGPLQTLAARVGLGGLPAPGRRPWRRDGPDGVALGFTHDRWRGRVADAWRLANPDLRLSGASIAWREGFAAASREAARTAERIEVPVLILRSPGSRPRATALCGRLPRCEDRVIAGARPGLHLEADAWRDPWLDAVAQAASLDGPPSDPGDF